MKKKTLFPHSSECPHCQNLIAISELKKIPFRGKLKWYQFTPSPKTACPYCDGLVKASISNSPHLAWIFFVVIGYVWMARIAETKPFTQGLWIIFWILLILGILHFLIRTNYFVIDHSPRKPLRNSNE